MIIKVFFSPFFKKKMPVLAPIVTDSDHVSLKATWNLSLLKLLNNLWLLQIINALWGKCGLNDCAYCYLLLKSQHDQVWSIIIILDTILQERVLQNKKSNAREQQGSPSLYCIFYFKHNKVYFMNYKGWYSTHLTSNNRNSRISV